VLAGVPRIMQAMFDSLKHRITGGAPLRSRAIVSNLAEGVLARRFRDLQEKYPAVEMGSYPFFRAGRAGTSLVLRATDEPTLDRAAEEVRAMVRGLGGDPVDEAVV
jgi:molybdopterin-biosynthesis enzyme MoeA-like protein